MASGSDPNSEGLRPFEARSAPLRSKSWNPADTFPDDFLTIAEK